MPRKDRVDRNAYKQSKWARVVDLIIMRSSALMAEFPRDEQLQLLMRRRLEWCDWMITGGFRCSDLEIIAKMRECFYIRRPEMRHMIDAVVRRLLAPDPRFMVSRII